MRWRPAADDRERIMISRASTVMWALVLFAIAVYSIQVGGKGHVVEIGLSIASVAYGALLGVFLLGTLTKYATQTEAIIGMVVGFALNVALWQQPHAIVLSNGLHVVRPDRLSRHLCRRIARKPHLPNQIPQSNRRSNTSLAHAPRRHDTGCSTSRF
jgi:Na+(H+)/acetate symporter ActP